MSKAIRIALEAFRHMRVEIDEKSNGGEVFDLIDGKVCCVGYARNAEIANGWNRKFELVRQALAEPDWRAPLPELADSKAVVLYFPSDADRDEFVELIKEAKPGLISRNL